MSTVVEDQPELTQNELEYYRKLSIAFIKNLMRIRNVHERKAIAMTVVLEILRNVTPNRLEAIGMLEYIKQAVMKKEEDESQRSNMEVV